MYTYLGKGKIKEEEKERLLNVSQYVNIMMLGLWRSECRRCIGHGVGVVYTNGSNDDRNSIQESVAGYPAISGYPGSGYLAINSFSGNGIEYSNHIQNGSTPVFGSLSGSKPVFGFEPGNNSSSSSSSNFGCNTSDFGSSSSSSSSKIVGHTIIYLEDEVISQSRGGYNVLGRTLKVYMYIDMYIYK
jgi:hypothetical protein